MTTIWKPMSRRQLAAKWIAEHGMPTFASWLYRWHNTRVAEPEYVGKLPPRRDVKVGEIPHFFERPKDSRLLPECVHCHKTVAEAEKFCPVLNKKSAADEVWRIMDYGPMTILTGSVHE